MKNLRASFLKALLPFGALLALAPLAACIDPVIIGGNGNGGNGGSGGNAGACSADADCAAGQFCVNGTMHDPERRRPVQRRALARELHRDGLPRGPGVHAGRGPEQLPSFDL